MTGMAKRLFGRHFAEPEDTQIERGHGSGFRQMNLSAPFIKRPAATTLLTAALALSGVLAFRFLPVAPLPAVELPTVQVHANLPGASPETMASVCSHAAGTAVWPYRRHHGDDFLQSARGHANHSAVRS